MRLASQEIRFRRTLQALRQECPLLLPVRVVRIPLAKDRLIGWSYVGPEERAFRIVLSDSVLERGCRKPRPLGFSERVELLVHEWAHCRAWKTGETDLTDHGPLWGVAYAECYRAVIED